MGSREVQVGSEKGGRRPCGLPGSPRASGSGPLGPFGGVRDLQEEVRASILRGKTNVISKIQFFDLSGFW